MNGWGGLAIKYLLTAIVVVVVSEVARRSGRAGALLAALPLVTLLVMVWLHVENAPVQRIADHAWYTFWYVVPTLPMFLAFPTLLARLGFWPALAAGALLTVVCFLAFALLVRPFGVHLLP